MIHCPHCGASAFSTKIDANSQSFRCSYCNKIVCKEMYEKDYSGKKIENGKVVWMCKGKQYFSMPILREKI